MRIHLPRVKFSTALSTIFTKSFPDFGSYTPFPVPPTEEKFDLERSMEESLQQVQNFLNSQSFPHQTPYISFLEYPIEEKSELEKSLEVFYEITQQFQNILDSSS